MKENEHDGEARMRDLLGVWGAIVPSSRIAETDIGDFGLDKNHTVRQAATRFLLTRA